MRRAAVGLERRRQRRAAPPPTRQRARRHQRRGDARSRPARRSSGAPRTSSRPDRLGAARSRVARPARCKPPRHYRWLTPPQTPRARPPTAGLSLEAENAQLRVENEQLLQQITRLALFVEEQEGLARHPNHDEGHSSTKAAPAPAAAPSGSRRAAAAPAARTATTAAAATRRAPPTQIAGARRLRSRRCSAPTTTRARRRDVFEWVGDGDEDDDPGSAWSDGRRWRRTAARRARACASHASCRAAASRRCPGRREVWEHLAPTTPRRSRSRGRARRPAGVGRRAAAPGSARGQPAARNCRGGGAPRRARTRSWLGCNQLRARPTRGASRGCAACGSSRRDLVPPAPPRASSRRGRRARALGERAAHDLPRSPPSSRRWRSCGCAQRAPPASRSSSAPSRSRACSTSRRTRSRPRAARRRHPGATRLELEGDPLVSRTATSSRSRRRRSSTLSAVPPVRLRSTGHRARAGARDWSSRDRRRARALDQRRRRPASEEVDAATAAAAPPPASADAPATRAASRAGRAARRADAASGAALTEAGVRSAARSARASMLARSGASGGGHATPPPSSRSNGVGQPAQAAFSEEF